MGGTTLRQAITSAPVRDRFVPRQRPPLRLVPPLPDAPPTMIDDPTAVIRAVSSLVGERATVIEDGAGSDFGARGEVWLAGEDGPTSDAYVLDDLSLLDGGRRPQSVESRRPAEVAH